MRSLAVVLAVVGRLRWRRVALFRLPRLRRVLDPLLLSYYAVPVFVLYPMLIVIFGLNRWPLVGIGFLFARRRDGGQYAQRSRTRAARAVAHARAYAA